MRVRTYRAPSMHEALRSMRRELGESAIILSTHTLRLDDGTELVELHAVPEQEMTSLPPSADGNPWAESSWVSDLRRELLTLRQQLNMLEALLRFNTSPDPLWQRLYTALRAEGFTDEFLLRRLPPTQPVSSWKELLLRARQHLTNHIRTADPPLPSTGPLRLLVLGAPGSGKTSTLLKLLLMYKLLHHLPCFLISTEAHRLGALEQLQLFSSIADIPLAEAYTVQELRHHLAAHPPSPMVVGIELPGGNPFRAEIRQQWQRYVDIVRPEALYGVLSATDALPLLRRLLQLWHDLGVTGLILTKLDLAPSVAPVVEALEHSELPVIYFCTGPRIPEDIEPARSQALAYRIGTVEEP